MERGSVPPFICLLGKADCLHRGGWIYVCCIVCVFFPPVCSYPSLSSNNMLLFLILPLFIIPFFVVAKCVMNKVLLN